MRANGVQENSEPTPSGGSDKPAVVLDTNVLFDGLAVKYAKQAKREHRLRDYQIDANRVFNHAFAFRKVCFTVETKDELRRVLLGRAGGRIGDQLARQNDFGWIMARAQMVEPGDMVRRCFVDPDDDHIIRAATGAGAAWIVTADRDLTRMKTVGDRIQIITPETYIGMFIARRSNPRRGPRSQSAQNRAACPAG